VELHLRLRRRGRLARDAYAELREAILDGRLRPGERLPPTRELARSLGVSRNTVLHAYEGLVAEGFLAGRAGAGTFVAPGVPAGSPRRAPTASPLSPRAPWARGLAAPAPAAQPAAAFDFQLGAPDPALFPWDTWRGLVAHRLRGRGARWTLPQPEGEPRLREALARHLGRARAVLAGPDDVLVTAGAQQAFDLAARVLLRPGDVVAVEDPGYPPAREAFRAAGAKVVPVRVDAEGLDVDALPRGARLVYTTPSHQFPLGVPMSLARRLALLAWAEREGAAILEDDYDSEFRYEGRPLEPLQSLDRSGRVLYVGTFSKVLLPGLRMGFLVAPAPLQPALRRAKAVADSHGPVDVQRALADLLEEGLFARHVRRVHRAYAERRARLLAAIDRTLEDRVVRLPSVAGLHVSVLLRDRRADEEAIVRRALARGVRVEPLGRYRLRRGPPGLALGYGLAPAGRIAEGVARLGEALDG